VPATGLGGFPEENTLKGRTEADQVEVDAKPW
jgi:hypothetical protein